MRLRMHCTSNQVYRKVQERLFNNYGYSWNGGEKTISDFRGFYPCCSQYIFIDTKLQTLTYSTSKSTADQEINIVQFDKQFPSKDISEDGPGLYVYSHDHELADVKVQILDGDYLELEDSLYSSKSVMLTFNMLDSIIEFVERYRDLKLE